MNKLASPDIDTVSPEHYAYSDGIPRISSGECGLNWGGIRASMTGYAIAQLLVNKTEPDFPCSHQISVIVVKDALKAEEIRQSLNFFAPEINTIYIPAWDCHTFERVSPDVNIASQRMGALCDIASFSKKTKIIVIVTLRGIAQKIPPINILKNDHIILDKGFRLSDDLYVFLQEYGFERVEIVRNRGEYAVRGGLIDIFSYGEKPIRCDFFGNKIESIHSFDPIKQNRIRSLRSAKIFGTSEIRLEPHIRKIFTKNYRKLTQEQDTYQDEQLLKIVSDGGRPDGIEHWLGYCYSELNNIIELCLHVDKNTKVIFDESIDSEDIGHHYDEIDLNNQERINNNKLSEHNFTQPQTNSLYINKKEWTETLSRLGDSLIGFTMQREPSPSQKNWLGAMASEKGNDFSHAHKSGRDNYKNLATYLKDNNKKNKRILICFDSPKTGKKVAQILRNYGVDSLAYVKDYQEWDTLQDNMIGLAVIPMEEGFKNDQNIIITQRDILGDVKKREYSKHSRSESPIQDASMLKIGELVVHNNYGIGRYEGIEEPIFDNNKIACLRIGYLGGDSILLPVHNLDMLSRYQNALADDDNLNVQLDKLGSDAWEIRKLKAQKKIMEMASKLLLSEAKRTTIRAQKFSVDDEVYSEFCSLFPYNETPDQEKSEIDIIKDLNNGFPMDRLICGDVGFGKTEIAMRTAFIVAYSGYQVAVVAPTTLLAHQHFTNFKERFQSFNLKVEVLSRFVKESKAKKIRQELNNGNIDIIVGTHSLLSSRLSLSRPGLVVLDEEQSFGVLQKEKIKRWNSQIHILTLSATPIPRTLQMALSGVRDMSIIATPPINRQAIRTYVAIEDDMMIRRAMLHEIDRNGKIYYICPHIKDLQFIAKKLSVIIPEAKFITVHGQMKGSEIEDSLQKFIKEDINTLVATPIVGAGLDIPSANTMIVHRSQLFGLAPLYQLRGRIGRSHIVAHCYLTYPYGLDTNSKGRQRINILKTNDGLGAGFNLASYDLDLRGAGNLLGSQQSGHIREIGSELYQKMLSQKVRELKNKDETNKLISETLSPQVRLGFEAIIPKEYIPDVGIRLQLYHRLSNIKEPSLIVNMKDEISDRFGKIPSPVHGLLHLMSVKIKCRNLNIEKLDARKNGLTIKFYNNTFSQPQKLLSFINERKNNLKIDPKQNIVGAFDWRTDAKRLRAVNRILDDLKDIS